MSAKQPQKRNKYTFQKGHKYHPSKSPKNFFRNQLVRQLHEQVNPNDYASPRNFEEIAAIWVAEALKKRNGRAQVGVIEGLYDRVEGKPRPMGEITADDGRRITIIMTPVKPGDPLPSTEPFPLLPSPVKDDSEV